MLFRTDAYNTILGPRRTVSLRCPGCRQLAVLEPLAEIFDVELADHKNNLNYIVGERRCPNATCRTLVFFVLHLQEDRLLSSYPVERLDFDTNDIPAPVAKALEEAITCHANGCYVAAAIMVRKTLEELCHDRKAKGDNLKKRIAALSGMVLLPKELLDGADELRLLGNDAAHLESQTFNQVGPEELAVAIDFTKEVLKAVYQYSALLVRFRALKKQNDANQE